MVDLKWTCDIISLESLGYGNENLAAVFLVGM